MSKKIAVLVGSLRKASINRKFAHELVALAPATLEFEFLDTGALPLYNQDLDDEGQPPAAWSEFRQKMAAVDGVLFVTPEYNRSIPANLKNVIDVGSRPAGKSIWGHKAVGVVSCSPGAIGGFGANHHLRQTMVSLNAPVMPAPEAYIGGADKLLDDAGKVNNDKTREVLGKFMAAFASWVETNGPKG